jgi:hypothetical protein
MTPLEAATGEKPDLSDLQVFGMPVWIKQLNTRKLETRASRAWFVGYDDEFKGYRVFWPEKRKVTVERDAYFKAISSPELAQIEEETEMLVNQRNHQLPSK